MKWNKFRLTTTEAGGYCPSGMHLMDLRIQVEIEDKVPLAQSDKKPDVR